MGLGGVSLLNVFVLIDPLKTPIHPANPSLHSPFSVRPAQRSLLPSLLYSSTSYSFLYDLQPSPAIYIFTPLLG